MAKIGRQTPTVSVVLPYTHSKGAEAVNLYKMIGKTAQEWQHFMLNDIMAWAEDGLWVHTRFGYSLPRRNGKSEILTMREFWGLFNGEHIMHTAHRTTTTHSAWEKLLNWVEKTGMRYTSIRANGRERIDLIATGGRIEYRTRTSKSGLGEAFDLLIIDEAQEYTDDQESALKYIVTDSKNPQILMCGTPPTPFSSGTVFKHFRDTVIRTGLPDSGWGEWSVDEETDPRNKDAWYETNPSLGTIFTERSVTDEVGSDTQDFNIQRLGLWMKQNLKSVITTAQWDALQADKLPKLRGRLHIGVKYSKDGDKVAVSLAVKTYSKRIFIEALDCVPVKQGNAWIVRLLAQMDVAAVIIDGASGQALLEEDMKREKLKKPVLPSVKQIITANTCFEQALYDESIVHMDQPSLKQSVCNVDKRSIGSNGGFGYKSIRDGVEVALLDSVILAHWSCMSTKEKKKQRISY
ncbi:phage terminase large subunit-like protein [Moryella indoligenes]|uniref:Phage terminase large subunit-like protein n=1 Tax=Moryella indoligenes TaxID=371674 RepID=A0AAE3VCI8_9FIRM|nr:terminase TerL endonuclease subunit [Moryella indoligenes]MDQ0153592.1 phage terminase large subunit-like protein [Moryella indoligenes]